MESVERLKIKLFQKPVGRIAKESFINHACIFLLFFVKALHFGKYFSLLFITDLKIVLLVERSLTAAISCNYLICLSNARVLTKSVKIDQSEG